MNQLTNLRNLLAVGERILAERLPLNWRRWDCGTHACLYGHYRRSEGRAIAGDESSFIPFAEARIDFGLSEEDAERLFTPVCSQFHEYLELGVRLAFLRQLIADREPKFTGLPSMVRALFEGEAVKS
jgi:hypothetical protein